MAVGPNQVTRPIDEALCQRKHHLECLIKENGWMWCTHKTKETNHYDGDSSSLMVERHFVKKIQCFPTIYARHTVRINVLNVL